MIRKVAQMVSSLRTKISISKPTEGTAAPRKIEYTGKRPVVRQRPQHCVSRKNISPHALKVLLRLQSSGHIAYLVGGSVRDLLLEQTPKDFDVSTDAHPNQIKRLFRNCWLIGRRFRLAHIKFGSTIIETSTFRKNPTELGDGDDADKDLLVRSDNTFGTPEEDAFRRDFTINGLFYDLSSFSVIDYVGGLKDLDKKIIRSIGDPMIRFREDPIRMLRAVRFASRLGFKIERKTLAAIIDLGQEIEKAAPARLVEEFYKFFGYGSGEAAVKMLSEVGLLKHVIPCIEEYLENSDKKQQDRYWSYLHSLDTENKTRESVNLPLAFSVLFYPIIYAASPKDDTGTIRLSPMAREVLDKVIKTLTVPRRIRENIGLLFSAQDRFMSKRRRRFNRQKFIARKFIEDALALYSFAVEIEGLDPEALKKWQRLHSEFKASGAATIPEESKPAKRTNRRRPKAHRDRRSHKAKEKVETNPETPKEIPEPVTQEKPKKDDLTTKTVTDASKPKNKSRPRRSRMRSYSKTKSLQSAPAPDKPVFLMDKKGQEPTHWMDEI